MALLLLFFGGFWAQVVSTALPTPTPGGTPGVSEALNTSSLMSTGPVAQDPQEPVSTWSQSPIPSSPANLGTSGGSPTPEPTTFQEASTKKSSVISETSSATSGPTASIAENSLGQPPETGENMTRHSPEIFNRTSGPLVAMGTRSQEPSKETSGPPVTMATSALEPTNETSRPSVTMATSSLQPSNESSGPPVTMATSALEPSNETHGLPVTMATSSLEPSGGPSVTTSISSLETLSVASSSSVPSVNIPVRSTPRPSTGTSPPAAAQRSNGSLLLAVLVALLVGAVLVVLLLLWRRRQKRRTGVLTLSRSGKRNGVVDAWAGPAQVPNEEATTAIVGVSGGDKGTRVPEPEASGQRPMLTTFFSRRKSRQGSLALEELKPGSGPRLQGEEEPLVGSEDEAGEAPSSCGPEVGDGAVPRAL